MPPNRGYAITRAGSARPIWDALLVGFGIGLLIAASAGGPLRASAEGLNPLTAGSDSTPINITAASGIEWDQNKQIYVARGNAVAIRGTSEVHADVLTAHYRPSKDKSQGGNEVYRLDADGHVVIIAPNRTVVGDQAIYDVDQQIGIVTGQHLRLTTPTDVVTARDSLEWYDQQQVAVARGDAVAIRGARRIRADVLTAHFIKDKSAAVGPKAAAIRSGEGKAGDERAAKPAGPAPAASQAKAGAASQTKAGAAAGAGSRGGPDVPEEGNSRLSRADAQGHVVVVTATDIGRGDYGVYNAQTGIVTLLGNVTVTRGQDEVKGQYAVMDLNTNVSRMMTIAAKPDAPAPRVEGLFYRQDAAQASSGAKKSNSKPASGGTPKSSGGTPKSSGGTPKS
jgi:lipopolysaccharide export system protein LptA